MARCRLTSNPDEYQACLHELIEHEYTTGDEKSKPWEGEEKNAFADCAYRHCWSECNDARFSCDATRGEYRDLKVWLAVRKYGAAPPGMGSYLIASDAQARACVAGKCDEPWEQAQPNGVIELKVEGKVVAEELYFEIKPKDGESPDFPPTLYYPRRFSDADPQLAAAYVVRNREIESGNGWLGFEAAVLTEEAQSLILPDGCTWEEVSVPDMRISVKRVGPEPVPEPRVIPQCHELPLCLAACRRPCVWYARKRVPDLTQVMTDGTGAGAVGLAEGMYEITAEDEQKHVSRRTVRMRKGWMTVARTWPVRR